MDTLHDLRTLAEQAADADAPLVTNWPQARAALLLVDRAIGLRSIGIPIRSAQFPDRFEDLGPDVQDRFPGRRVYDVARREISRLLAAAGRGEDPWEALRVLIRQAGHEDHERRLWALMGPAREAALAPHEVLSHWVWALDAEQEINGIRRMFQRALDATQTLRGAPWRVRRQVVEARRLRKRAISRRQTLRAAAAAFDRLFDIETIAASGLLPRERIGAPPEYDRLGRQRVPLPPRLRAIDADARGPTHLQEVWQAISATGIDLPDDPCADALLAPEVWAQVAALPANVLGLTESSWTIYLQRAKAALRAHAIQPLPETPADGLASLGSNDKERWALRALGRRVESLEPDGAGGWTPHRLLELETWRALWRAQADDMTASTLRLYESAARKALLRHARDQADPLCVVKRAWADLPGSVKPEVALIRPLAERALLRPADITSDWLETVKIDGAERVALCAALEALDRALAVETPEPEPDPVAIEWQRLRAAARGRGVGTSRLGVLADAAIGDRRSPREIDAPWARRLSATLSQRRNARLREVIRLFDGMRSDPRLAPLLPPEPVGPLPDLRRRGNLELPADLAAELEAVGVAKGYSASTRKGHRSLLRELHTRAVAEHLPGGTMSLRGLLHSAADLGATGRKLRMAKTLSARLPS